jgi:hypothetical protein
MNQSYRVGSAFFGLLTNMNRQVMIYPTLACALAIVNLGYAQTVTVSPRMVAMQIQTQVLHGIYTIQQQSTQRYLDAHDTANKDYRVVTRPRQDNATQRWFLTRVTGNTYRIRQQSTLRYVDAHDTADRDFAIVTRPYQPNATQEWLITPAGDGTYVIMHAYTRRYLDAHDTANWDFGAVTRPAQPNTTQRWILTRVR